MDDDELTQWKAIVRGEVQPSWDLLTMALSRSNWLTESGKETSIWALEQIASFLGDAWLKRSFRDGSPLMSLLWATSNDAPLAHLGRIELGARLALLRDAPGWRRLRKLARGRTGAWTPVLLQLEVGGLALRDGRGVEFEPPLATGKFGDLLIRGSTTMLVETTSVGLPKEMREASRFSDRALLRLQMIGAEYGISVAGTVAEVVTEATLEAWLHEVTKAAGEIAGTGRRQRLASPGGSHLELIDGPMADGETISLRGPTVKGDEWLRLALRIRDKAEQGETDHPLWIRIDEGSSLWGLTEQASWPRPVMHAALATNVLDVIGSFRHVAGVVVAGPLIFGVPGGSVGSWELVGGNALSFIAPARLNLHREAVMVMGAHEAASNQLEEWHKWYAGEGTWLDWALEHLGQSKSTDLIGPA